MVSQGWEIAEVKYKIFVKNCIIFWSLVILKTFTLETWNVQHFFFVSSVYFFVKLKHSVIKKVFVNWCASTRHNFIFWNKIGNFRGFRVFDFDPYTKIENSENSEIFSRLLIILLKDVGNFRGFRVFDFGPYTKIENSENSEIVSRLVKLIDFFCLFEEVGNFQGYWVFPLTTKTWKTRTVFQSF